MSFLKKLFAEVGTKDVITLFHSPKNPSSIRVYTLLKQVRGNALATATEDQASDHANQSKMQRTEFDLEIEEKEPTEQQLESILEYAGDSDLGSVVQGATSVQDALRKVKQGTEVSRPLLVDWNKGKIVAGDKESEILKMVKNLPHTS